MGLKKTIATFAMLTAPMVLGGGLATNADAASSTPKLPEVYAVDSAGKPLNDVVFSGSIATRGASDLNWSAFDLDSIQWTHMYGHSNTLGVSDGPQSARKTGGFNSSFPNSATTATSCADATMRLTIRQTAAPAGYSSVPGSITVCQTAAGWVQEENTTGGGITFTSTPADQIPRIVIHDAKGVDAGSGPTANMGGDGSALPSVAKVEAAAPQYGVAGMKWNATLSYDTDGDGVKDKTVDVNTVEGLSTALTMGDQSYSDEIEANVPWNAQNSTDATSCANSPAQLTVWETAAPSGYQKVDKPATLCLIGGRWVQTATPDDSTGWIKYDNNANLIRFGEFPVAPSKPGSKPSKPAVTVISGGASKRPGAASGSMHVGVPQRPSSSAVPGKVVGPKVSTDQGVGRANGATEMEAAAGLLALAGVAVVGMKKVRKQ